MSRFKNIFFYSFSSLVAYFINISPLDTFAPQIIALFSIILIVVSIKQKRLPLFIVSFIITLIVLSTGGLTSPVFFFVYFLLFVIAFQSSPLITLGYSVVLILILSGSLNSFVSLIPLFSLLFITPLAAFVSSQYLENQNLSLQSGNDKTDVMLWYSLNFKKFMNQTLASTDYLLQNQHTTPDQKAEIYKIKNHVQNLLDSSLELTHRLENENNDQK